MVMKPSLFMFVAVGAVVVCLLQLHQVVAKGGQTSDTAGTPKYSREHTGSASLTLNVCLSMCCNPR